MAPEPGARLLPLEGYAFNGQCDRPRSDAFENFMCLKLLDKEVLLWLIQTRSLQAGSLVPR